jgi:hypothetical protein
LSRNHERRENFGRTRLITPHRTPTKFTPVITSSSIIVPYLNQREQLSNSDKRGVIEVLPVDLVSMNLFESMKFDMNIRIVIIVAADLITSIQKFNLFFQLVLRK